jgi:hypothetical protein
MIIIVIFLSTCTTLYFVINAGRFLTFFVLFFKQFFLLVQCGSSGGGGGGDIKGKIRSVKRALQFLPLDNALCSEVGISLLLPAPVLRIRDQVPCWPRDPISGMGKKSGSGFGVRGWTTRIIFPRAKYLNSLMQIRDLGFGIRNGKISDPGYKKFVSRIRSTAQHRPDLPYSPKSCSFPLFFLPLWIKTVF